MKRVLISFILILSIIITFSSSVLAYSPATKVNGQYWETEPNNYPDDATILFQQSSTVYPTYGAIRYVNDDDNYLYRCNSTSTKTLRVGKNSTLNVSDAGLYVSCTDITDGYTVFEEHALVSTGATARFQAVSGHEYAIFVSLEGPVGAIQEELDWIGGQGFRYLVSLN